VKLLPMSKNTSLALTLAAIAGVSLAANSLFQLTAVNSSAPRLIIWSWDYPQDLSFIKPQEASVAYYGGTAYLRGGRAFFKARSKDLKVASGVLAYPVLRIESDGHTEASGELYEQIGRIVEELRSRHDAGIVQIDFDATESEWTFYRGLLSYLKSILPTGTELQITALASWCNEGSWLAKAPCDEKIAMLFSMGENAPNIPRAVQNTGKQSIGLSVSEPRLNQKLKRLNLFKDGRKIYLFSPRPWTEKSWLAIKQEVMQKW
jgi:hypothetical protein